MWSSEDIEDYIDDFSNIAFSEEFSFCLSTPEYDENEIFYESLLASIRSSSPIPGSDIKTMCKRSPILFENTSPKYMNLCTSSNSNKTLIHTRNSLGAKVDDISSKYDENKIFHKSAIPIISSSDTHNLIHRSHGCLSDGLGIEKRRKSYPTVFNNTKQYCMISSDFVNRHNVSIRTRNSLGARVDDLYPQYDEDEVFHKSLITSKCSPYLSHGLDITGMGRTSPTVFKKTNSYSASLSNTLKMHKDFLTRTRLTLKTPEIQLRLVKRDGLLGFSIATFIGGIFIKALTRKHAVSGGKIRPGDRILQVNGRDMSSFALSEAIIFLRNVPGNVTLKICRCCSVWRICSKHPLPKVQTFNVTLDKLQTEELSFAVWNSVKSSEIRNYLLPCAAEVETIYPGSLAHKHGVKKGDRILEVNGDSLLGKTVEEVADILKKTTGVKKIVFCRLQ